MSYTLPVPSYIQQPTYLPENSGQQTIGFETCADIVRDMADDLNQAYALLDDERV
jgi:hypothetical protein